MRRDHWQRKIAELDPETQYEEIARLAFYYEFPWDYQQALSFALFRTYAVPSIGGLLFDTGEFTERTQKRHDDTALVLESVLVDGIESPGGRAAVRRMNQMHGSYDISNDDLRYVLATFVVVPHRWLRDYGWRRTTEAEVAAAVRYYQRLGALMGIKDIPDDLAGFEELMDSYEAQHFAPDPKTRAVAEATLELLVSFYPRILAKPVERVQSSADGRCPARRVRVREAVAASSCRWRAVACGCAAGSCGSCRRGASPGMPRTSSASRPIPADSWSSGSARSPRRCPRWRTSPSPELRTIA